MKSKPSCYGDYSFPQAHAERGCDDCVLLYECIQIESDKSVLDIKNKNKSKITRR